MSKSPITKLVLRNAAGKLLMQFRDGRPNHNPLMWTFFGGAIEEGEDPQSSSRREAQEELHVSLPLESLKLVGSHEGKLHQVYVFVCQKAVEFADITLTEGAGLGFFTLDEVKRLNLTADARYIVELYEGAIA